MPDQTVIIHIKGYWREKDKLEIPERSGLLFVYESKFNEVEETADLLNLIYIGADENIRSIIEDPGSHENWDHYIASGNTMCFAFAETDQQYRKRVHAAYIHCLRPPGNYNQLCEHYPFETLTIVSTGKTALIDPVLLARKDRPFSSRIPDRFGARVSIPVRAVQLFNRHDEEKRVAI
ncbi:MAG: hypothetical protein EOM90_03750 [Alphaproteobacteria bacterium]|nr:hypothetical protein [Alphaproteobacteria bacterium]